MIVRAAEGFRGVPQSLAQHLLNKGVR